MNRRCPRRVATVAACLATAWAPTLLPPPTSAAAAGLPALSARAAVLVEASTGQRLFGKDAGAQLPIASTTKLMTALVTLEHVPLERTFAQNYYTSAPGDSQIGLVPGERMSVHDLLVALLLPSADDAAEDLAYNVGGGSVDRFVAMMNARARALGLAHTHYATPSGLDTPGNYSSASDLVRLASLLLEHHPFFARTVALARAELRTGSHPRVVVNRNDLVGRFPWISGVKTGHTLDAGYVLVASAARDGMTLLSAVLGDPSESARDADSLALLQSGFANFRVAMPVRAGMLLGHVAVKWVPGVGVAVIAAHTLRGLVPRTARVSVRLQLPRVLAGPLPRRTSVGRLTVLLDGRDAGEVPLLVDRAVPAATPRALVGRSLTLGARLLVLVLVLSSLTVLVVIRRGRGRQSTRVEAA